MKQFIILCVLIVTFVQTSIADEFYWKGTSPQTSWREGANWEGGTAPSANDVAVIADNVTALATCKDDVDFMNTLGKVKMLGSGSVLCISNLSELAAITVPLEGTGTFMHRNQALNVAAVKNGSDVHFYPLTINADNSAFTGTFVSTNAGLKVQHANALGGKNGGIVRIYLTNVQRFGLYGGHPRYNELYIKGDAYYTTYLFSANPSSYYGNIHVLGPLGFHANSSGNVFNIYGDVTVEGNYGISWSNGGKVVYYGKVQGPTGTESTYGSPDVGGASHSKNFSRLFMGGTMKCLATNVFAVGYTDLRYGQSATGILDLNGFDQELSGILLVGNGQGAIFKSQSPARLSMINNAGTFTSSYYYFDGNGMDAYQGNLTLVHVPTNATAALQQKLALKNMTCTTTGGIEGAYGTLTLDWNASFPNLTKLSIRDSGSLVVNSTNALGNVSGTLKVSLQGTGTLTIAEGAEIRAQTANAGTNAQGKVVWLNPGEYTGANLPAYLAGSGKLIVSEYGGPKGLMILIR